MTAPLPRTNRPPSRSCHFSAFGLIVALLPLAGCSRSAPAKSLAEGHAETPASAAEPEPAPDAAKKQAPEKQAPSAPAGEADAMPALPPPDPKDRAEEEGESLGRAPKSEAFEPSRESDFRRLKEEETFFQGAISPEALSCSGALPRRDAICTLADRICELAPAEVLEREHEDCTKARASCAKAKQSYAGRCGG